MYERDYKAIAEIFRKLMQEYKDEPKQCVVAMGMVTIRRLVPKVADYFEKEYGKDKGFITSTNFDREQFIKNCGVE